jgi:hypothetical protein
LLEAGRARRGAKLGQVHESAGAVHLTFVAGWFRRWWLLIVFVWGAVGWVVSKAGASPWFDGRLYLAATETWLAGGDPWLVTQAGQGFAAPPPTLLVLAPFALVPGGLYLLAASCVIAAFLTVRVLRLPLWWLLFPPLLEAVWSANIHVWLIPLLLGRAGPIAVFAKAYALAPLVILGRWRTVAMTAVLLTVTAPLLPWATFVADLPTVVGYFGSQSQYRIPIGLTVALAPVVLVGLLLVGRRRAAWFSVPALFGYQFYYAILVLPTRSWLGAAVASIPLPGFGLVALIVVAIQAAVLGGSMSMLRGRLPTGWIRSRPAVSAPDPSRVRP